MKATALAIPEVLLIEPTVYGDERGFFLETYEKRKFEALAIKHEFVQDNHSRSIKNTLRGLHYQIQQPQGKLVRVVSGEVFDVAVDMRRSSPTFGHWVGEYLSGTDHRQLWVPPGFAHGFLVISESADFVYKCTDFYAPEYERSVLWNDSDIGIDWPVASEATLHLSDKDARGQRMADAEVYA